MNMKDLDAKLEALVCFQRESAKLDALVDGHMALWKAAVMGNDGMSETEHRQKMIQLLDQRLDLMARIITQTRI